jgi:hypothetical protein
MPTLQQAVQKFANDLAEKINSFIQDTATLNVRTYTTPADQIETVISTVDDSGNVPSAGKAMLRAYTAISFDGDTTVMVPTDDASEVNKSVWDLHQQNVKEAQANRTEMLKAMGEAAASALKALRSANE